MKKKHVVVINLTIVAMLCAITIISIVSSGGYDEAVQKNAAIYQGNVGKNTISLMINVYWGEEYLPKMLDILRDNNVKCTFFIGGMWIEKNIEMLQRIKADGHEIGNHGYTHKDPQKINYDKNFDEMNKTNLALLEKLGITINLYAPPSGSLSADMFKVAERLKMKVIMWSKDTIDWRDKNTETIYNRATKKLANGDLILMHPTKNTAEALPNIIKNIRSQGFLLDTVSKNIE